MKAWVIAFRSLVRRPGYAATAVLMLTLGIGASTGMFSVVDTILWKPLPYPAADRLVTVLEASPAKDKRESLIAPARLEDWSRLSQAFEAIAGSYSENLTETSGSEPERLEGRRVSPRYFEVYGTKPLAGRTFNANEEVAGGPGAALISYGLWTRRYAQGAGAVGSRLIIGGEGYTIVGVMPKEFAAASVDVWIPAQLAPAVLRIRGARFYSGVGRMKPGVTIAQAREDLARVERRLGEMYPQSDKDWSAVVGDLKELRVGDYRRTLVLVFGAVGLLLAIAVANIAGLTLAQLHRRGRELAIRSSLGASRAAVVAQDAGSDAGGDRGRGDRRRSCRLGDPVDRFGVCHLTARARIAFRLARAGVRLARELERSGNLRSRAGTPSHTVRPGAAAGRIVAQRFRGTPRVAAYAGDRAACSYCPAAVNRRVVAAQLLQSDSLRFRIRPARRDHVSRRGAVE